MTNLVKKTIMFLRKRMTDKELDRFLISTFKNILADTEDNASYINSKTYKDYQEVQEDIDFSIKELKELGKKIFFYAIPAEKCPQTTVHSFAQDTGVPSAMQSIFLLPKLLFLSNNN